VLQLDRVESAVERGCARVPVAPRRAWYMSTRVNGLGIDGESNWVAPPVSTPPRIGGAAPSTTEQALAPQGRSGG
jgi:hypothetical protein